jgi:acetyl/propionyl-CoA carboxylase alpha subunit
MSRTVLVDGQPLAIDLVRRGDKVEARLDGSSAPDGAILSLAVQRTDTAWRVTLPDRTVAATVVRDRDTVWVAIDGEIHRCTAGDDARTGGAAGGVRSPRLIAPMPGKVLAVRVEVGQEVVAGDPLIVLEAMKMETIVSAEAAARVVAVHVTTGAMVEPGQTLVELEFPT